MEIPIDNIFSSIAERHGFKTTNIHVLRQKRVGASIVGSSVRQGEKTKAHLYESAVVLQKTKNAKAISLRTVKSDQMAFDLR